MVGGTDEQSLDTWAEGAARVGGLSEELDSTKAELMGAYAVLHKVRNWEGTVRIWVDNDNVVIGLERRFTWVSREQMLCTCGQGQRTGLTVPWRKGTVECDYSLFDINHEYQLESLARTAKHIHSSYVYR